MKLRHHLARARWRMRWPRRAKSIFKKMGDGATDIERAESGLALLWPLALDVFCMHRFEELSYPEIADDLSIDVETVEICIFDALTMLAAARRGRYPVPIMSFKRLRQLLGSLGGRGDQTKE